LKKENSCIRFFVGVASATVQGLEDLALFSWERKDAGSSMGVFFHSAFRVMAELGAWSVPARVSLSVPSSFLTIQTIDCMIAFVLPA